MGHGRECCLKRSRFDGFIRFDNTDFRIGAIRLLLEFLPQNRRRKFRAVNRAAQARPEIRHRANMVFMCMGNDQRGDIFPARFQKGRVGQENINARKTVIGKTDSAINRQPFAACAVDIEIDPELLGPAQRDKIEFVGMKVHQAASVSVSKLLFRL